MIIKEIDNNTALKILKQNDVYKKYIMFIKKQDFWLGAVIDNKIVGISGYSFKKDYVSFGGLYVLEDYRKKGIGTLLCEECIKRNKNKKIIVYGRPLSHPIWNKLNFKKKQTFSNGTVKFVLSKEV